MAAIIVRVSRSRARELHPARVNGFYIRNPGEVSVDLYRCLEQICCRDCPKWILILLMRSRLLLLGLL